MKLYDKASAPSLGTDVPIATIQLKASTSLHSTLSFGLALGLAYAITNFVADNDATVVAANDVVGFITYK